MPVGSVRAKRFGGRQYSAAFPTSARAKAPEDWRSPRRFALAVAHPIFIVRAATGRGMLSDLRMRTGPCHFHPLRHRRRREV